jgi:hypothetical protein
VKETELPVFYCTAHRRKLGWMPNPGWWIHDDGGRLSGHPGDPRGCRPMWDAVSMLTVTRKDTLSWLA